MCFPRLDPALDLPPEQMFRLVKGIEYQGGRLVDLSKNGMRSSVDYVLAHKESNIRKIRKLLRKEYLVYVSIVDYKWVEDSLRRFSLQNLAPYNLENGQYSSN